MELPLKFLQFLFQYGYPLINGVRGQMDKHSNLIGRVSIHFQHRDLQGELVHCQQGFEQFRIFNIIQQILSKLFNGTENFTLKQFRTVLPYLNISEDVSERCLSYVAFLENSEIFWRGFEHHKQQKVARKKLRLTEEKPK